MEELSFPIPKKDCPFPELGSDSFFIVLFYPNNAISLNWEMPSLLMTTL